MPEKQEVQEWYGRNARVMHSDSDCLIERYECQGKGLIVTYKVFEGMEMVFMSRQKSNRLYCFIVNDTAVQSGADNVKIYNIIVLYCRNLRWIRPLFFNRFIL